MDSPPQLDVDQDGPSFDDFLREGAGTGIFFVHSSPIHNHVHPSFQFDASADTVSPYALHGRTPAAKLKRGAGSDFLVSPLQPHRFRPTVKADENNKYVVDMRQSHISPALNVLDLAQARKEKKVNEWEHGQEDEPNFGMIPSSPTRFNNHLSPSHVTPTQSPSTSRQPTSLTRQPRRSVTGIGSPSNVDRSGGMKRQATAPTSIPHSPSRSRHQQDYNQALNGDGGVRMPSEMFLSAPMFGQERNVSGTSGITASTSDEQLISPYLFPTFAPDLPMTTSQSLPAVGAQGGSPISKSRSPALGNGVFFASPEEDQNGFMMDGQNSQRIPQQPQITFEDSGSLMSGVDQIMGNSFSVPNSAQMSSAPSFNPNLQPGQMTSLSQSPMMHQNGTMMYQQAFGMPPQATLQPQSQFQNVEYPSVPGINRFSNNSQQAADISQWASQTYTATSSSNGPCGYTSQAPSLQRHVSAPYLNFGQQQQSQQQQPQQQHQPPFQQQMHMQQDGHMLSAAPVVQRTVSAPGVSSSMPSMSMMPTVHGTSGLFGGPPQGVNNMNMGQMDDMALPSRSNDFPGYNRHVSGSASLTTSPETPRSRKTVYPRVGKPLKPGPKPKPKTPKGSESSKSKSPMEIGSGQGGINPALLSGKNLSTIAEDKESGSASGSKSDSPPKKEAIQFGPDLATMAIQRAAAGNPLIPNSNTQQPQPQLVIDPPRTVIGPDGQPITAGLPKSFLEKLYNTFFTMEGSVTGQPVKRFKCLIEGCERHFPRKSAIHSHIQTHLEDKPFVCSEADCGAAFVRQHDLRRHMRIHSGTKPFPCPCGKGFARGDALHRHRQRGICAGSIVPRRGSPDDSVRYQPY